jgi:hypothetical protein
MPTGGWQQPPMPTGSWQQPPPQYSYGWQPVRSTNGLAIAALVTAFNATPVSIGLSIGALVQLRKRNQAGKGLAISALVVSSVLSLLFTGILVAGFSGAFDSPSPHLGSVAKAASDRVGSCLQTDADGRASSEVPCGGNHDQEVFFVAKLPGETFPGTERVDDLAQGTCLTNFRPYVGQRYGDSPYEYAWYAPDPDEWASGEHRVVCVVTEGTALRLDGSVRNSA